MKIVIENLCTGRKGLIGEGSPVLIVDSEQRADLRIHADIERGDNSSIKLTGKKSAKKTTTTEECCGGECP